MKNETLLILALAGLGIYLYMKKNNQVQVNNSIINPEIPINYNGSESTPNIAMANDELYRAKFSLSGYKKKLGKIPNTI